MNNITNEQLDSLIKSAVNSSGPLPPDEKFAQIISALRELRELRAAMLQGAEPVTTAYKLPANTSCKEAPEHIWLQTAGVWPENGEFSELTWCSDNQHEDDTLYVRADVVTGNSPVIPDGWVMVPVEPTEQMIMAAGPNCPDAFDYLRTAYKDIIAAAPQQEVK
ncbi:hypothetical protein ACOY5X_05375 [Enterobacter kobei]|uniref:hypothetical protein n=1 Tax=Enterobacter kobei TaxID=208224 RepID=UPI003BEEC1E5